MKTIDALIFKSDHGFVITNKGKGGVIASGKTLEEAREKFQKMFDLWLFTQKFVAYSGKGKADKFFHKCFPAGYTVGKIEFNYIEQ